jgi:hypothetical protein
MTANFTAPTRQIGNNGSTVSALGVWGYLIFRVR